MDRVENDSDKLKKAALSEIDDFCMLHGLHAEGYSESEAVMSRKKYGANDLIGRKQETILYCLKRAFINPFSVILFFLGIISFFTDVLLVNDYQSNPTLVINKVGDAADIVDDASDALKKVDDVTDAVDVASDLLKIEI